MPAVWILGAGSFSIWQLVIGGPDAFAFLAALVVGTFVFYWFFGRLKKVTVDGENLLISNFRRQAMVPLSNLLRASGSIGGNTEIIWLHFKHGTPFGKTVLFMPPFRPFAVFSRHPLVQELNALARTGKYTGA
jgi:hypothetical protein